MGHLAKNRKLLKEHLRVHSTMMKRAVWTPMVRQLEQS